MIDSLDLSEALTIRWGVALGFSLIAGHFIAGLAMGLCGYWSRFWGSIAIGVTERAVFTIWVGFGVQGVGTAMVAWTVAKMAAGWNVEPNGSGKSRRFAALRGDLTSVSAALVGGLIASGRINW